MDKKRKFSLALAILILAVLAVLWFTASPDPVSQETVPPAAGGTVDLPVLTAQPEEDAADGYLTGDGDLYSPLESADPDDQTTAGGTYLDEDGTYSAMEDVALYLHTYGQLPDNFITKNEARDLGWSGGGLESYAPGKCIGGDVFGNKEGLLPKGNYRECDINTLGEKSRGAERIVWDDRGNIYYTSDHYESFELIYAGN